MRTFWSTEQKIVGGFGVALLVLCVVAGVSVWLTLALLGDLQVVSGQNEILSRISEANVRLPQVAAAARLYAADRKETTFVEWEKQEAEFEEKLNEIEKLTHDNVSQRQRIASAQKMLRDKTQATNRASDREMLDQVWGIKQGISQVRPINDVLLRMSDEEREYLGRRNNEATRAARAALWTIGLASLLAIVLVGGAVAVIMRDLRGKRRAAEELERARLAAEAASVAKSAFLANMSHELRTPLTSIMGYADLLLGPEGAGSKRQEYLRTMRRSGEHLLTLINDILDLSKIEAGRMAVERVECRLFDVFADVDSLMRSRTTEKGISFTVEYKTDMPDRVWTDPTRFRQILMNLVGNAVKFTDTGGVRVVARMDGSRPATSDGREKFNHTAHRIQVDVIDTGVGISAEQAESLFQPFIQADASTTRRFGGTGLGLSISRRLAHMLGGDLTMRSELGEGSIFTLTLPMASAAGATMLLPEDGRRLVAGIGSKLETRQRQLGLRVLLAEDGEDNREVILLHLTHAGCEVTAAVDGGQAFDTALAAERSGERFDAILMDMQMPVMDGYTATSKLRAEGYTGVIIALTAHAMEEDRQRCLSVGCDEYVSKPVDMPALLGLIARFCGRMESLTVTDKVLEDPMLRKLAGKFCANVGQTVRAFRGLAQNGQWEDLAAGAHKLAGAGGAYGFENIARGAKKLEILAKNGAAPADIAGELDRLEEACTAASGQLQEAEKV